MDARLNARRSNRAGVRTTTHQAEIPPIINIWHSWNDLHQHAISGDARELTSIISKSIVHPSNLLQEVRLTGTCTTTAAVRHQSLRSLRLRKRVTCPTGFRLAGSGGRSFLLKYRGKLGYREVVRRFFSKWHHNCSLDPRGFQSRLVSNYRRRTMAVQNSNRSGKIKYGILGWLIGLPLPIVIILLFVRGCDF